MRNSITKRKFSYTIFLSVIWTSIKSDNDMFKNKGSGYDYVVKKYILGG